MATDCTPLDEETQKFIGSGYTWEKLQALEDALASGVRLVRVNNRTTEFQSATQMLAIKEDMLSELRRKAEMENPCNRRRGAFKMRLR